MTEETLVDQMINGHHYELIYVHPGFNWTRPSCYYAYKDFKEVDHVESGFVADIPKPLIRTLITDTFNGEFDKEYFFEHLRWRPY
jgi:hypothetical protein